MHQFIFFNRQIFPAENAFLSAVSSAALYGRGIFTTVAVHNFTPFLWEKHWRRLAENAVQIGLDLKEFSEETTKNFLAAVIKKNKLERGRARLTFFDESATAVWGDQPSRETNLLIQTADFRLFPEILRLTVAPFRVNSKSPLAGVKSCNYLENILALENAAGAGFDEAIRLNERGEIVSACLANIFWRRKEKIYTPALETGCLRGTTREFILENFAVEKRRAKIEEIYQADEIFLTSAGIGVVSAKL